MIDYPPIPVQEPLKPAIEIHQVIKENPLDDPRLSTFAKCMWVFLEEQKDLKDYDKILKSFKEMPFDHVFYHSMLELHRFGYLSED